MPVIIPDHRLIRQCFTKNPLENCGEEQDNNDGKRGSDYSVR